MARATARARPDWPSSRAASPAAFDSGLRIV
jgi:hypothetical protein